MYKNELFSGMLAWTGLQKFIITYLGILKGCCQMIGSLKSASVEIFAP